MAKYLLPAVLMAGLLMLAAAWLLTGGAGDTTVPAAPAASTADQPNIVLLVFDALRADTFYGERNGGPLMPNLTALAEQSKQFTNAVTPCTWTRPAMASLFTAQYPETHGVMYGVRDQGKDLAVGDILGDPAETMAEYLAAYGYDTYGVQTNSNAGRSKGLAQGFAEDAYVFGNNFDATWVRTKALEALPGLEPPFFLYAHFMETHAPYESPGGYMDGFGPAPELTGADQYWLRPEQFIPFLIDQARKAFGLEREKPLPDLSPGGREMVKRKYDAAARYLDDEAHRLLQAVLAEFPNTIVVGLADHGEELWEHGGMGHGTTLHAEQVNVPFFIHGPGIAPGTVHRPASILHLLPTLAPHLGLPPRPAWQGRNLFAAETGAPPVFSWTRGDTHEWNLFAQSVQQGDYKLILRHNRGERLLYNTAKDPRETENLAAAHPRKTEHLEALLREHHYETTRKRSADTAATQELTPEAKEQLKALGYLGGAGGE